MKYLNNPKLIDWEVRALRALTRLYPKALVAKPT